MKTDKFFITRDAHNEETGVRVRHCWTGTSWSGDLEDMAIYDRFLNALSVQFDLSVLASSEIPAPGVTIFPADIRQL